MKKFVKNFYRKQKGFTLIELLVVIAILGILAAIIVPNVTRYISSGNQAAADTELHLVQNAVAAAMADAKVPSVAGWTGTSNLDVDHNLDTGKLRADGTHITVADYFGDNMDTLLGVYTVTSTGVVTQVSYNGVTPAAT